MKWIAKIEIKNFRSLRSVLIKEVNDLNIFSGGNDVGKSNVLRALDNFFNDKIINFDEDFNIYKKASITKTKEKQTISVKIWFINYNYQNLPPFFSIKKTWGKNGKIISQINDTETWRRSQNISAKRLDTALSMFMNRFKFTYIPAIKDNECFNVILTELYNAIISNTTGSESEFTNTIQTFNDKLSGFSQDLSKNFEEKAGIPSTISIPTSVNELAKRLSVSTHNLDMPSFKIPLFNRGDGIRMHYIPSILNQISHLESKKWHIWAFDEPETSCEYSKSYSLAEEFLSIYSVKNQIFISSHSFHFITLKNEKVSRYRALKKENNSDVVNFNKELFTEQELQSELGILKLLDNLQEVYDKFREERKLLQENIDIVQSATKSILFFEGESDRILFKKAFDSLYSQEADNFGYSEPADTRGGGVIGEGASSLAGFLYSHIPKIGEMLGSRKIIAIFDNDKEGVDQFNKIAKEYSNSYSIIEIDGNNILKHKNYSVYILKLIAPTFRDKFVHKESKYCYLSTELLLHDDNIPISNRDIIPDTLPQKFSFKSDKKIDFANKIAPDSTDFSGFKKTIDLIRKIKSID